MNISKINPIGYETKTEKGNTYKRSNIAKAAGMAAFAALDITAAKSNNKILKMFSGAETFKYLAEEFKINVPKKLKPVVLAAGVLMDLTVGYSIGKWIDNSINKKRAAKADAAMDTLA